MAAYRRVYDSRRLQGDCQEPGSAPEPYARRSSMGYLYHFYLPKHLRPPYRPWPESRQTTGLQHVDFAAYVADTISSFSMHTSYSRSTYDNPAKILQRFTKF